MERIKMTNTAAGPAGSFQAGREYAVPVQVTEEQAMEFIAVGAAHEVRVPVPRAVVDDPAPETATAPRAETATARPARAPREPRPPRVPPAPGGDA